MMTRDPVCRMQIPESGTPVASHEGRPYRFCSPGCKTLFEENPAYYIGRAPSGLPSAFDLIIIGGGPAGLSAAIYASIQRMSTLLVTENIGGQAAESTAIKNYMGFFLISGRQLIDIFRDQLIKEHFVQHKMARVARVAGAVAVAGGDYQVLTADGESFRARALIIATGMARRRLGVPGEERFQWRGVYYHGVHEAGPFEGRDVAVVGGGNSALQAARDLSRVARSVHLIVRGEITGDADEAASVARLPAVRILSHSALTEIVGEDEIKAVRVRSRTSGESAALPVSAAFVAIGFVPNSALVSSLVQCNERGEIGVRRDCSTSARGVFAAGDVTDAFGKRVIIASGEGAKAALAAREYLAAG